MNPDYLPILEQLNLVFQDVFDDEALTVAVETTAKDVDGWNSLAHIRLMVSIEKEFKCRFSAAEISGLKNVGEMVSLIAGKQARG
jgi:acyl carrier protein